MAAEDCDYESPKKLGLICPFCKEAVYLFRGSQYKKRSGQQISTSPGFSHYHSDDPMAQQCELRAKRKEGQEYLAHLEVESKNQRLKLFNDHLWKMIASQIGISRQTMLSTQKWIGMRRLTTFSRITAKRWQERESVGWNYEIVVETFETVKKYRDMLDEESTDCSLENGDRSLTPVEMKSYEAFRDKRLKVQTKWLSAVDEKLHLAICKEICSFLGTRTAGYAMQKMCTFGLRYVQQNYPKMPRDEVLANYDFFFGDLMRGFAVLIAEPHWAEEITKRGNWNV